MEGEERPLLGRRVVVYGGGNTAMDAARTAKRLGATDAIVVYRRTRERMPAHDFEVEEAEEEGVMMKWLSTIKHAEGGKLVLEQMELDETGFPQPTGELEELEADSLVLALGQEADLSLLDGVPGIEVAGRCRPGRPEHDDRPPRDLRRRRHGARRAHRHGRDRARQEGGPQHRRAGCAGRRYEPPPKHELATFDMLNTWYYSDAPRTVQPQLEVARRRSTFEEVVGGLDESTRPLRGAPLPLVRQLLLLRQLLRRLPRQRRDQARRARTRRYEIDLDFCKGCGLCVAECPCGAIEMVPEEI